MLRRRKTKSTYLSVIAKNTPETIETARLYGATILTEPINYGGENTETVVASFIEHINADNVIVVFATLTHMTLFVRKAAKNVIATYDEIERRIKRGPRYTWSKPRRLADKGAKAPSSKGRVPFSKAGQRANVQQASKESLQKHAIIWAEAQKKPPEQTVAKQPAPKRDETQKAPPKRAAAKQPAPKKDETEKAPPKRTAAKKSSSKKDDLLKPSTPK